MTTIILEKEEDIKTCFIDLKDLYSYIMENQIITEFGELGEDEVDEEMLKKMEKAKKLPENMFVNLK